jgi:hypothetical protein
VLRHLGRFLFGHGHRVGVVSKDIVYLLVAVASDAVGQTAGRRKVLNNLADFGFCSSNKN